MHARLRAVALVGLGLCPNLMVLSLSGFDVYSERLGHRKSLFLSVLGTDRSLHVGLFNASYEQITTRRMQWVSASL